MKAIAQSVLMVSTVACVRKRVIQAVGINSVIYTQGTARLGVTRAFTIILDIVLRVSIFFLLW